MHAPDIETAHAVMYENFGQAWAFIQPAEDYTPEKLHKYYPAGEYTTITATEKKGLTS